MVTRYVRSSSLARREATRGKVIGLLGCLVVGLLEGRAGADPAPDEPPSADDHQQGPSPSAPAQCAGTLDVHVFDQLVHEPVADATVRVQGETRGSTNERGQFTATKLCASRVTLEVVIAGYAHHRQTVNVSPKASVEVQLEPIFDTLVIQTKAVEAPRTRSTAVVSGEKLESKRGQSLADAISDVPGVSQVRSGSGFAKPMVRGNFGRRLPILVDGVRHRSQDWGLDHAPELDPFVADRISVVRGASGVRHGSDAIGGVLLVDPPNMPEQPSTRGEAHVLGSSNGLGGAFMGRVQTRPEALPRLALQLEGGGKRLQSARTPDYALDNTGVAEWSAGVTATYQAGDDVYKLSYRHYDAQLGVCNCLRMESPADFMQQVSRRRPIGSELYEANWDIARPYQAISHDVVLGRARWSLLNLGRIITTYALQFDDRKEFDVVRGSKTAAQYSFRLLTHDLDAVFEHNPIHLSEHHHLSGSAGVVGMLQSHSYAGLQLVPSHEANAVGVHVSERLWGHSYELEAGVRYDRLARTASLVRQDFNRLVNAGKLQESSCGALEAMTEPVRCASVFHTVSASVGGVWKASPTWSLKLDLSTASRPPNPDEQYINGSAPSFPVFAVGEPTVGAETTYSSSATAAYESERMSGEVSAFTNYVSDYIYLSPAVASNGSPIFVETFRGAFPQFTTRAVDARFYGADGYLSAALFPWLTFDVQGSMIRARNLTDRSYLVLVPPDRIRGSVGFARGASQSLPAFTASVGGTYVRRQTRFDVAADLAPPPPGYALADAALTVKTRAARRDLHVSLTATNLLAARYREYASLLRYFVDQPGRQVMLRITMNFDSSESLP